MLRTFQENVASFRAAMLSSRSMDGSKKTICCEISRDHATSHHFFFVASVRGSRPLSFSANCRKTTKIGFSEVCGFFPRFLKVLGVEEPQENKSLVYWYNLPPWPFQIRPLGAGKREELIGTRRKIGQRAPRIGLRLGRLFYDIIWVGYINWTIF